MSTVAVIDYGMGNLRSVAKALEHVGSQHQVWVTQDAEQILKADHIVLPGVGALRDCMAEIQRRELVDVVEQCARSKPFLGICLGMQALLDSSEENGGTAGLAIIPGQSRHFSAYIKDRTLKIPHMGWNQVHQEKDHPLWQGVAQDSRFYFVHSYYAEPAAAEAVAATSQYGGRFVCALAQDNIFAAQFHPEKSQQDGLKLLANFLAWDGSV